jgi:2-polyprenyl-6-methoxyphenol hydroxylase-like FAD-dependent oxidoreductase
MVLRPALHGTLLATVGAEALQLGRRVAASPPHAVVGSGFSVLGFSTEDPDLTPTGTAEVAGEVVVGADGVGSVVRRWLHPEEPAPRPSGYRALRGVTHDAGAALGNCDAAVYFGDAVEIGLTRASATAVYWYISLLDEGEDLDAAASIDRCGRGLDARALDIMRAARPDDMRVDRLFVRDPLTRWGSGRVTLLGDAAHPVLPHTAQGAALALEDAVALGLALGATGSDVEPSLRRYERVRAARTRPVVTSGPRLAAMTTTRSRASRVLRDALIRAIPARALTSALARHARDPHRELR